MVRDRDRLTGERHEHVGIRRNYHLHWVSLDSTTIKTLIKSAKKKKLKKRQMHAHAHTIII